MEILMLRGPAGFLPADEESWESAKRIKTGTTCRVTLTQVRNPAFMRKWFALAKLAYDAWTETVPTVEHRGQRVQPQFERFRKDLTILAGYYHPVFNVRGELRLEADSISFAKMDEATFDKLYNATINAVMQKVLAKAPWSEEELRALVDKVLGFC